MNLKPLGDRVIVEPIEKEEMTAAGIYVPETAKEKPQEGLVVAAGPGRVNEETGKRGTMDVADVTGSKGLSAVLSPEGGFSDYRPLDRIEGRTAYVLKLSAKK